jgi:hypothetical protein
MHKFAVVLWTVLILASFAEDARAESYDLRATWRQSGQTDATRWTLRYVADGGKPVLLPGLSTRDQTRTVEAPAGTRLVFDVQACELGECSEWSAPVTVTLPDVPAPKLDAPSELNISVSVTVTVRQ